MSTSEVIEITGESDRMRGPKADSFSNSSLKLNAVFWIWHRDRRNARRKTTPKPLSALMPQVISSGELQTVAPTHKLLTLNVCGSLVLGLENPIL